MNGNPSIRRRSPSPDDSAEHGVRKRRRAVLSCYDCRRRKLKCDREYPACSRCVRSGHPQSCIYDPNRVEPSSEPIWPGGQPAKTDASNQPILDFFERENAVARTVPPPKTSPPKTFPNAKGLLPIPRDRFDTSGRCSGLEPIDQAETMVFRGGGFQTQWYGASYSTSLLAHFPELRGFMKSAISNDDGSIIRVRSDLKHLEVKRNLQRALIPPPTDCEILDMVPSQEQATKLAQLHCATFETVFRVLHVPTFWRDFEEFWKDPQNGRADFAALLLMVCATVMCTSSSLPSSYIGGSSSERDTATLYTMACESWLRRQSRSNMDLTQIQVRILAVLARQTNYIKKKEMWEQASGLLRWGMAFGYHRDPLLSKMSCFEAEMRRRLWATMVEIDLQQCVERGMTPSSFGVNSDAPPPTSINDDEFNTDTKQLPPQRSPSEFTMTAFQVLAAKSRKLRTELTARINDHMWNHDYDDVMAYDQKIRQQIEDLPTWSICPISTQKLVPPPLMSRHLLDIQLRQYLLMLHSPFARRPEAKYDYSRWTILSVASTIIEAHDKLATYGSYGLLLFRADLLRAVIGIYHQHYLLRNLKDQLQVQFLPSAKSLETAEVGLNLLEQKVIRLGTLYSQFWFCGIAHSFYQSTREPDRAKHWKQSAIDRVTKLYYKVLASQMPPPDAAGSTTSPPTEDRSTIATPSTAAYHARQNQQDQRSLPWIQQVVNGSQNPLAGIEDGMLPQADEGFEDLDLSLSGWTLDNFWSWPIEGASDW